MSLPNASTTALAPASPAISSENSDEISFPLDTRMYIFSENEWKEVRSKVCNVLAKTDDLIKEEKINAINNSTNKPFLLWIQQLDGAIFVCRIILDRLTVFKLSCINDKTASFLQQMQKRDFMSIYDFKKTIKSFLAKLKMFRIQLKNELIPNNEIKFLLGILDKNATSIKEWTNQTLRKSQTTLQENRIRLIAEKELIKAQIIKIKKHLSNYMNASEMACDQLETYCINIQMKSPSETQRQFTTFNKTFTQLSDQLDKSKNFIERHIKGIQLHIAEVTKVVKNICVGFRKNMGRKTFFRYFSDMFKPRPRSAVMAKTTKHCK